MPHNRFLLAALACVVLLYSTTSTGTDPSLEDDMVARAIVAGGCFWCMEPPYDKLDGVISTTSGYTGGHVKNPTYRQVSGGGTGHIEAVEILYNPQKVSFATLLQVFWRNVDPTRDDGQFCDRGPQYRPALFYLDETQKQLIDAAVAGINANKPFAAPLKVAILPVTDFYPAEEYHQDYYRKNPVRYRFYRYSCGRDARLEELWGESP